MKNPPDFVMYVVMVKYPKQRKFAPAWKRMIGEQCVVAFGFQGKQAALRKAKEFQEMHGKDSAYVQQYGPYS